ncbi:unnamed protein product [Linum trigynum]|uniref:Uncharacterized protein n=1 Tax=Linum trigynum TaxID=586398 RepID=A0AAV2F531_9ROSI
MMSHERVDVLDCPTTTSSAATVRSFALSSAMSLLVDIESCWNNFFNLSHLNGHLLVVMRSFTQGDDDHYRRITFHVFKLVFPVKDGGSGGNEVVDYMSGKK